MKKRVSAFLLGVLLLGMLCVPIYAADVPRETTPNYRVAFYAYDNYNMQDEAGRRYGYGYEMMQGISQYLQATFSYVGYDKSATECVEMLRNGELDLYTAAKITPEREAEFAVSTHPAITATTCMNVKVSNTKVIEGDYATYNGLRIGLLQRHTYNDKFLAWAESKGFTYTIVYYDTPTELTRALVDDEVDAIVDSYIRTPEDERTLESFGQTAYYIIARKEDQNLIDQIDAAIDSMSIETPNWRVELYNKYYGSQERDTEITPAEQALLEQMQVDGVVIKGVMDPEGAPYSWYENGEAKGIAADIFRATAQRLGLDCEIVPVADRAEYREKLTSGEVDVWMDLHRYYEDDGDLRYRTTEPYLTTTVSVLRSRSSTGRIQRLAVIDDNVSTKEIIASHWPEAQVEVLNSAQMCVEAIISGRVDGALLMTYSAQKLAREDVQNRMRVDIVPGASLNLRMGVYAEDDRDFFGLWEKTLFQVSQELGAEVVQPYVEETDTPDLLAYLFDHPMYLISIIAAVLLFLFVLVLYTLSIRSRNKEKQISAQLSAALAQAEEANTAKQDFFSKMSHDIRTPLNVVLGMTQIAQKYKKDTPRLENALDSITSEGNYLLMLINSILDVNQLEHGRIELRSVPFAPTQTAQDSVDVLRPLAEKKEQNLTLDCGDPRQVVVGDPDRLSQIMVNIISNAIKYTEPGGTIQVSLTCTPEGRCRFVCRDNGMGMTPEFLQHITEDYARAEDSRISKIQGTGLGMSVVKGFTDRMGGTLDVQSELGKGSVFTVELPFSPASEEQRAAVLKPQEDDEEAWRKNYSGKRVLLAEDNALNAEIAMELLQSIGLTVDWADNGAVAVERFEQSQPGTYFAVFMDMQMPVMDGVEATRTIRASTRPDRDVPIFAMTANTFATDRERCFDAGMSGYIPKPINVKVIEETLKESVE